MFVPAEKCCRFRRYRSKDYGPTGPSTGPISSPRKGAIQLGVLTPRKGGRDVIQPMDSNSSDTVAVISLGGAGLGAASAAQVHSAPMKNHAGKTASSSSDGSKGVGSSEVRYAGCSLLYAVIPAAQ